jgi:hypothetical protein
MLGQKLAQALDVGLSANDFQRLAARLSILVESMDIESNGLGYNNLIFMAVVLSELAKNANASFRSLIVEERRLKPRDLACRDRRHHAELASGMGNGAAFGDGQKKLDRVEADRWNDAVGLRHGRLLHLIS